MPDDDKSKSSLPYWGAGKTLQKPVAKPASVYSGESSANVKFRHRPVSSDSLAAEPTLKQRPGLGGLSILPNGPIVPSGSREGEC